MAKKSLESAGQSTATGPFNEKTVGFVGKFDDAENLQRVKKHIEAMGAQVVDAANTASDYLVAGRGQGGKPPALVAKVQKKNPAAQVLDEAQFCQMLAPTRAEFLQFVEAERGNRDFWTLLARIIRAANVSVDLTEVDFQKKDLSFIEFRHVDLRGADFSGAKLDHVLFGDLHSVKFDGATISETQFARSEDCSFRDAFVSNARMYSTEFVNCDFTGTRFREVWWSVIRSSGCTFDRAEFTGCEFRRTKFANQKFAKAKLHDAELSESDLSGAVLTGSDLSGANFTNARLEGADLSLTDLRGSCLLNANLTNAVVAGANFDNANIIGINLTGVDTARAKLLDLSQLASAGKTGPKIKEFEQFTQSAKRLEKTLTLDLKDSQVDLWIGRYSWGTSSRFKTMKSGKSVDHMGPQNVSLGQSLKFFGQRFRGAELRPETIKVKAPAANLDPRELKRVALEAWCEALGCAVPTDEEIKAQRKAKAEGNAALRDELVTELRRGAAGVKKWNARKPDERQRGGDFRKIDFSGLQLADVDLSRVDLREAKFNGANLTKARFDGAMLDGASFQGADLTDARLAGTAGSDADFALAKLRANLSARNWKRANFRNINLDSADLSFANICRADFTGANSTNVTFNRTKFDETTKFPAKFEFDPNLYWVGKGTDPRLPKPKDLKAKGPLDIDKFMTRLQENVDGSKLAKALSMLKADRFKLYAQVEKDSIVGVVKSQSDSELVYSCRLASDGSYACCTQNLNVCGGLRGSLCKHLIVLIVGLAKGSEFDLTEVDSWAAASGSRKPELDKDVMSATFLRYKGAEAGELDWRPTETIPKDFYTM